MHTFKKVGGAWCVHSLTGQPGQTVTVTKRNGQTSTVVLGEQVAPLTFALGTAPRAPAAAAETVGDLSRIVAMFDRARAHLRFPAIVLDGFRISVAGARASEPGSLTVTGVDRDVPGRFGRMERRWFGRVSLNGSFQPSRAAAADLGDKLRRFAADPAGEAAAYGRLHGACCFCNRALRDERSTAVGYGPDCADHYGLPWGSRAAPPALDRNRPTPAQIRRAVRAATTPRRPDDFGPQPVEDEPFELAN
jgi:hypothetical protein